MPAPFTPSGIYRTTQCTASAILPRAPRTDDQYTARGTGFHAFVVRVREIGYEAALAEVPDDAPHRALCDAVDPTLLPIDWDITDHELAIAYDVEAGTSRALPGVTGRRYGDLGEHEMPGSIDLHSRAMDSRPLTISDIKTGRWSPGHRVQLRAYALAAARLAGASSAAIQAIYVEDGSAQIRGETLDAFDLDDVADELRALSLRVRAAQATGTAPTNPGDWCRYCDCRPNCPAHGAAGAELEAAPSLGAAFMARVRADVAAGEAARWWQFLELAPAVLDDVRAIVEAAAPFDLPDGRKVQSVTSGKRRVQDADKVHAALTALGHGDAADRACTMERATTLGRIEKALGGKKSAESIVKRLIANSQGITESTTTKIEATGVPRLQSGAAA